MLWQLLRRRLLPLGQLPLAVVLLQMVRLRFGLQREVLTSSEASSGCSLCPRFRLQAGTGFPAEEARVDGAIRTSDRLSCSSEMLTVGLGHLSRGDSLEAWVAIEGQFPPKVRGIS